MWPGFIGTLTGINEHGLYGMMDTGHTYDGPAVQNLRPGKSWCNILLSPAFVGKIQPSK